MLPANNKKNFVELTGIIYGEPVCCFDNYETTLKIARSSGTADFVPLTIGKNLMNSTIQANANLSLSGQFCSYNQFVDGRSKLQLYVLAQKLLPITEKSKSNHIELSGFLCKTPVYRITPLRRKICDFILAVINEYNKCNYFPCIAWEKTAETVKNFKVGDLLSLIGRIQSRTYQKVLPNGEMENRIAYEVSVYSIEKRNSQR